jgi:hypothetical protein
MQILQDFQRAQGPANEHHPLMPLHTACKVIGTPVDVVAMDGNFRFALAPGIKGNSFVSGCEGLQRFAPEARRHAPAGYKHGYRRLMVRFLRRRSPKQVESYTVIG